MKLKFQMLYQKLILEIIFRINKLKIVDFTLGKNVFFSEIETAHNQEMVTGFD